MIKNDPVHVPFFHILIIIYNYVLSFLIVKEKSQKFVIIA